MGYIFLVRQVCEAVNACVSTLQQEGYGYCCYLGPLTENTFGYENHSQWQTGSKPEPESLFCQMARERETPNGQVL